MSNKTVKKKFAVMWASTYNIGDDIQTLAAINFLKKHNIHKYDLIDREFLSKYTGEPVHLIMNGWFTHNIANFPPSKNITPIFVSFHCAYEKIISENIAYFKKYEPIGCRDIATVDMFKKYGIDAYFTGCMTLTFDKVTEKSDTVYFVDIMPNLNIDVNKYKFTEYIKHDIGGSIKYKIHERLKFAESLLNKYRKAKLVVTSRLHCALPCRAFGTHVKFIHKEFNTDKRFIGLEHILCGSNSIIESQERLDYANVDKIKTNFKILTQALLE